MGRRRGRINIPLVILFLVVGCCCCLAIFTTAGAASVTGLGSNENVGTIGPDYPIGRYVKLQQTTAYDSLDVGNEYKTLDFAELEVLDENDKKISYQRPVVSSWGYGAGELTDGNFSNRASSGGSNKKSELDSLTVDLGAEHTIKTLLITNRIDCCKDRAIGVRAVILDSDKKIVKSTPAIVIVEDNYEFIFDKSKGWSRVGSSNET